MSLEQQMLDLYHKETTENSLDSTLLSIICCFSNINYLAFQPDGLQAAFKINFLKDLSNICFKIIIAITITATIHCILLEVRLFILPNFRSRKQTQFHSDGNPVSTCRLLLFASVTLAMADLGSFRSSYAGSN